MENGGRSFVDDCDFKKPLNATNEDHAFDFLIKHLEGNLQKFKPAETYQQVLDAEIKSKLDYDR
jgi:hypothetical protein